MIFTVDKNNVESSFDRIAKDLLLRKSLFVNQVEIQFTEIEFYYYCQEVHEDNYTHRHMREAGQWRFHNQGIDITFKGDELSDGGILIRGISTNGRYVNGPLKSLRVIFERFGDISARTEMFLADGENRNKEIIKTSRHLPNKVVHDEFQLKPYRYLVDIEKLDLSLVSKDQIKKSHSILK